MSGTKPTQAMPKDDRKGAPDGTNERTAHGRSSDDHDSSYPNPHTGKKNPKFEKRGGQTGMGYHGSGQLGDQIVKPGGNANAGAQTPED